MTEELAGQRVLVTGGTGFIGGRVVERLFEQCRAEVRVLVPRYMRASRVARYPVELAHADITDADQVRAAAQGCAVIIHCAYGSRGAEAQRRAVNVQGTQNVLDAAAHHGARRIVHLSSQAVYGVKNDGELTESAPRRPGRNLYGRTKLEAEQAAEQAFARRGLPVVILQPSAVYGPFAPVWTADVIELMRAKRMPLIDGGDGVCNAVFIDDVVDAILEAAVRPEAVGETMLISNPEPVTWRDFYCAFEQMIGEPSTVELRADEVMAATRSNGPSNSLPAVALSLLGDQRVRDRLLLSNEGRIARKWLKRTIPRGMQRSVKNAIKRRVNGGSPAAAESRPGADDVAKPIHWMGPMAVRFHAAKSRIRIDRARDALGFEPKFGLDEGMRITEAWARWANLLPEAS